MFVVTIHGWQEETADLIRALANALGIIPFEARQRLIGGGPTVVASFAERSQAQALAHKVTNSGIVALVIDAGAVRRRDDCFPAHRFDFADTVLHVETDSSQQLTIPYGEIDLLLAGMSIISQAGTKTVTEHKFSIGKTILAGGLPMTKKVEHQEFVATEERGKVLYLHAGDRPLVIFSQNNLSFAGLGTALQLSRELNFSYFLSRLRQLCPDATYDDRLLNRVNQIRLLGPAQTPETGLDLAAVILARSLRPEITKAR